MAHDNKKELMAQFCIAYKSILAQHNLCATSRTGKTIAEAAGLDVRLLLSGTLGGREQVAAQVAFNELDLVMFFLDPKNFSYSEDLQQISQMCDEYSIPFATNVATAEVLIHGLERGDFAWRDIIRRR